MSGSSLAVQCGNCSNTTDVDSFDHQAAKEVLSGESKWFCSPACSEAGREAREVAEISDKALRADMLKSLKTLVNRNLSGWCVASVTDNTNFRMGDTVFSEANEPNWGAACN